MILLTGGSGLLGTELQKHIECYAPCRDVLDITNIGSYLPPFDTLLIVHCAAYTDVAKAEIDQESCYKANVTGTRNIASIGLPIVYISTEYVFGGGTGNYRTDSPPNPPNFYALTKLLGEGQCLLAPASLVIRCLFKPWPFEHEQACTDQWTSGDYVSVIARKIAEAIKEWDKTGHTIKHIGTGRKSTYDLAKQSRQDVKPCIRSDIKSVKLPKDTSLVL